MGWKVGLCVGVMVGEVVGVLDAGASVGDTLGF